MNSISSGILQAHRYHEWLLSLCRPFVRGRLLEVGFGHGLHTRVLAGWAKQIVTIDESEECFKSALNMPDNVEKLNINLMDPKFSALMGGYTFDIAICINVLEHIKNDALALSILYRLLKEESRLLLIVPAHMFLYGSLDILAGHYRRYSMCDISAKIRMAGFNLEQCYYFNPLGALGWFVNSKLRKPKNLSESSINSQIYFYDHYVLPLSKFISKLTKPFFGQSLLVVASKHC